MPPIQEESANPIPPSCVPVPVARRIVLAIVGVLLDGWLLGADNTAMLLESLLEISQLTEDQKTDLVLGFRCEISKIPTSQSMESGTEPDAGLIFE
jgi:hypothetical protein